MGAPRAVDEGGIGGATPSVGRGCGVGVARCCCGGGWIDGDGRCCKEAEEGALGARVEVGDPAEEG